ncbi:hypothetical protein GLOTRDRAFT_133855 [Gloeophyllum trabeum ATCC 11539]|uniref:Fungal-type protein kinase domain-containing protein n=1 Tax=Gloeophyllum trabeum (strain ATCC 11539 / FP-39264 / Madison 617) TaxID=670483 RepID=S7PT50_GLOTA|nr:uncharacterized protein GLOTRDRAFT_133855 [Gloeophyllum trabeum ATCC 11539]EPQ50482.1 hypothetical protein GLOTRDRAFT_133855 [Gloeophyllum trabeum ATCC 11539]
MSEPDLTPSPDTTRSASPTLSSFNDDGVPVAFPSAPGRATSPAGDAVNDGGRPHTPPGKQPPPVVFNTPTSLLSERPLSCSRKFQSQEVTLDTLRTEAGGEASRLRVGPVSIRDFMRITFRSCFEDVVENAPQGISNKARTKVSKILKGVPTGDGVELQMYDPLKKAMNAMCSSLWGKRCPIRLDIVNNTKDAKDPGMPDLIINSKGKGKTCRWPCALAFVEVKPNEKQDPFYYVADNSSRDIPHQYQTEVWNQFSHYATVSFKRRPRCFLCGLGVFGGRARFFRWDRSAVLVSDYFDYNENPEPLWQFLSGFGAKGYNGSGIDPTIQFQSLPTGQAGLLRKKIKRAREKRLISEEAEKLDDDTLVALSSTIIAPSKSGDKVEQYITIGPPLFTSVALLGRGTCTWLAVPVPGTVENPERSNEDHFVIIKDSWRDPSRRIEGDIYGIIHGPEGHVPGVARLRSDVDLVDLPDPNSGMHRTIAEILNKHYEPRKCPPRVHHRCILDSVGIPLSRFSSTRQALEAFYDVVLGHECMGQKDILHRDISVNNIMISAYPDTEMCKGFLIDMEYATVIGEAGSDGDLREITGTTQFLSAARVRQRGKELPVHETWNDLESLFWSLVYTFTHYRPHTLPEHWIRKVFVVADPDLRIRFVEEHTKKLQVLCGPDRRSEGVGSAQIPEESISIHVPLTSCIHEIADLVASHYHRPSVYTLLRNAHPEMFCQLKTHEKIKRAIRDALDTGDWPHPDDSATPLRLIRETKKDALDTTATNLGSKHASGSKGKRKWEDEEDTSVKRVRHRESENDKDAVPGNPAGCGIKDRLPPVLDFV